MHQRDMNCVYCESEQIVKNGKNQSGKKLIQRYLGKKCGRRFNERSGTPMANSRTPVATLSLAMKVKGSQGKPHIEWLKQEHPFTAISPKSDVHANHHEAQNSSLRRRASGYRRRQNLYAKAVTRLQRVLNMQRMIHNWVRPHWGLGKQETPAMAMGYIVGVAYRR
jgi:hypothetical protein